VVFSDRERLEGYLNPLRVQNAEPLDLLTVNGEHRPVSLKDVRAIYFVREFSGEYEPERKAFLSRPKLDGLWVRLKFRDNETLEGVVPFKSGGVICTPESSRAKASTPLAAWRLWN